MAPGPGWLAAPVAVQAAHLLQVHGLEGGGQVGLQGRQHLHLAAATQEGARLAGGALLLLLLRGYRQAVCPVQARGQRGLGLRHGHRDKGGGAHGVDCHIAHTLPHCPPVRVLRTEHGAADGGSCARTGREGQAQRGARGAGRAAGGQAVGTDIV